MAPPILNPVEVLANRIRAALRKFDPLAQHPTEARSAIGAALSLHYPSAECGLRIAEKTGANFSDAPGGEA